MHALAGIAFFVVAGAIVPLAIATVYLLANGAFFPFVEQVFMHTGGKGSIFTIFIWRPFYGGYKRPKLVDCYNSDASCGKHG